MNLRRALFLSLAAAGGALLFTACNQLNDTTETLPTSTTGETTAPVGCSSDEEAWEVDGAAAPTPISGGDTDPGSAPLAGGGGIYIGNKCAESLINNCTGVPSAVEQTVLDRVCTRECGKLTPARTGTTWGPPSCTTGMVTLGGNFPCPGRTVCLGCTCN